MVSIITARTNSPSIQDITTLLLNQETRTESKIISLEGSLPSVNLASNNPRQNNPNNQNQKGPKWKSWSHGNNNSMNKNKPQCQICTKFGHITSKCFF